jgi:hypothetical protein
VNVSYSTTSDTATINDYSAAGGTLSFAAGETTKTFTIGIKNNSNIEGSRKLNVTLSGPSASAALLAPSTAKLFIFDDEATELTDLSTFGFSSDTFTASQGTGKVYVTIARSGSVNDASVNFTTADLTAVAGVDYTASNGVVHFAIGETAKVIPIPVVSSEASSGKTFQVLLSNPSPGLVSAAGMTTVTVR